MFLWCRLRTLTLILSIYVLLMAVIPCCAFDKCAADETEQTDHKNESQGVCSPFFSCHNCSVPVLLVKVMQIEPVTAQTEQQYKEFSSTYIPGYKANCWNPPKQA